MNRKVDIIASCCVAEIVEINNPIPRLVKRKTKVEPKTGERCRELAA